MGSMEGTGWKQRALAGDGGVVGGLLGGEDVPQRGVGAESQPADLAVDFPDGSELGSQVHVRLDVDGLEPFGELAGLLGRELTARMGRQDQSGGRTRTYEQSDDTQPHIRGISDDNGRLMVFITHNSDYGDAWEWMDDPNYPSEPLSAFEPLVRRVFTRPAGNLR